MNIIIFSLKSKGREQRLQVLDDEFNVDKLIISFPYLITRLLNTSFKANNCWLGLPQLTNSSKNLSTFVLFLTTGFLRLLRKIDEVNDEESYTLRRLNITEELTSVSAVL